VRVVGAAERAGDGAMAEFGLNVDLAAAAVIAKGDKARRIKRDKSNPDVSPRPTRRDSTPRGSDAGAPGCEAGVARERSRERKRSDKDGKRSGSSTPTGRGAASEQGEGGAERPADDRPFLLQLYDEEPDSEEDSSSDEAEEEPGRGTWLSGDASKRRIDSTRFRVVTGQLEPTALSIFAQLSEKDITNLLANRNFGVVFGQASPAGGLFGNKGGGKGGSLLSVAVKEHVVQDASARKAAEEEDGVGADNINASMIYDGSKPAGGKALADKYGARRWPPRPLTDSPLPPPDKPPKARGSMRFLTRPRSTSGGASQPPTAPPRQQQPPPRPPPPQQQQHQHQHQHQHQQPSQQHQQHQYQHQQHQHQEQTQLLREMSGESGDNPMQLKKQNSLSVNLSLSVNMSTSVMGIRKNMKKLALNAFGGGPVPGQAGAGQQREGSGGEPHKAQERFLVAKRVPWIIPPPPMPKPPPRNGSNDAQLNMDFELLRMFCEDLYSTAVRLQDKNADKADNISKLQAEIQAIDDEIVGLRKPQGAAAANVVTGEIESITSGIKIGVERYAVKHESTAPPPPQPRTAQSSPQRRDDRDRHASAHLNV
jgi:hypothetical protein